MDKNVNYYVAPHGSARLTLSTKPGVVSDQLIIDNLVRLMKLEENCEADDAELYRRAQSAYSFDEERIRILACHGETLINAYVYYDSFEELEEVAEEMNFAEWEMNELPISDTEWEHGTHNFGKNDTDTIRDLSNIILDLKDEKNGILEHNEELVQELNSSRHKLSKEEVAALHCPPRMDDIKKLDENFFDINMLTLEMQACYFGKKFLAAIQNADLDIDIQTFSRLEIIVGDVIRLCKEE